MRYDLARFPLSDMIACAATLRRELGQAAGFDEAAQRLVDHLHERLCDGSGQPATVLVRTFRTARYEDLDEAERAFAHRMAPQADLSDRRCLVLRATRGVEPEWNDPSGSQRHRVTPLVSVESVQRSPMIDQLIAQLGISTAQVVEPAEDVLADLAQRSTDVFHVADAAGSPFVPAQRDFVQRYGVSSVIGFGAMLPNGDLFTTILFSRVPISRTVADRFRTVSLAVRTALLPFSAGAEDAAEEMRAQLAAVTELLDAHEGTALAQARTLESTSHGLQRLAEAALVINSTLEVDELLELITEQARTIVPSHQAVTSLTVGDNWEQSISSVSLSDRYAAWRPYDAQPDGSGIYRIVCEQQRPHRLTQAELESHPAWRGFGEHAVEHPPMSGWLAVPLTARDGSNLGLIQLSDRVGGDFTSDDEALLVQLAQLASASLENARLASMVAHEEAARSREEMLAGLSHDMKTPLAVISGLAATFSMDPHAPLEERVEGYAALSRQSKRLQVLVQRFLDHSALEAGRGLNVNARPVAVGRVVSGVVDLFRDHREIEVVLADGLPLVVADEGRLEQALANLVSNAIKFSPEGTPVRIEARPHDDVVEVSVRDQGAGIDPAELEGVWHKFRRGANARGTEGSGLGLYIARALVEAQGGTIRARTRQGAGSVFTVTLPRAPVVDG